MATSSKVQFKLEKLQEQALVAIDRKIELAVEELESYDDPEVLGNRIQEWRANQEERLSALFRRLGEGGISDHELAGFKIQPIPSNDDKYERTRAERNLRHLQGQRAEIVAKSESLVPDEEGNISLTKTQLAEFFGL